MKSRNDFYTLIARVFRKQVRPVRGRCCKNFDSHSASKNVENGISAIQKSYEMVASSSAVHEMPVDPVNSFLGMIRYLFASRLGTKLHEYVDQRHKDLGPIYRSHAGSTSAVFINSPEEYRKIFFQLEGPTPKHFIPEAWIIYNKEHSKNSRGLFFMEGEEWLHFRRILNKLLLKVNSIDFMIEPCGKVAKDLATTMLSFAKAEMAVPNLKLQIYDYSLQAILATLIGSTWITHKTQILREADDLAVFMYKIFKYSSRLNVISAKKAKEANFLWWNQFSRTLDDVLKKVMNVLLLMTRLDGDGLLKNMIDAGIKNEDLIRIVADLIIAAGDTTTSSTQWALYLLSIHPEIQERLHENVKDKKHKQALLDPLTIGILKETLRLYPTAPFLTRYIPVDAQIGGYQVSKEMNLALFLLLLLSAVEAEVSTNDLDGVIIYSEELGQANLYHESWNFILGEILLMSLYSSGRDPTNFIKPDQFQPERWTRLENGSYKGVLHPAATIPFAIGLRSCIGKKLAEVKINLALIELVKNFRIECINKRPVKMVLQMIAEPSEPIQLKLTPR
ncbi:cytochrome P450 315a1, mitochondrial-like isoform X2 [Belonocnema kinseyi]|uniref:cytochrome P450 315a1, mitochondrial-like isoform X2 n=1 Tax=Belonocnema kinseyi TaxID=2817044 RepID=UPI00143D96E1|nr:cytochrome P450 315a1, mitochondrial-like isoform X2 [Belonocnema kinseyi]